MAKLKNLNLVNDTVSSRPTRFQHTEHVTRSAQNGGTILGFLGGLVVGLIVAVVVAIFITRAPVPFVNKAANKSSDRVIEPKAGVPVPDPNQSLNSKSKPAQSADKAAADKPAAEKAGNDKSSESSTKPADAGGSVLGNVFNNGQQAGQASPPPTAPSVVPPASPAVPGAAPPKPATPAPGAPVTASAPVAGTPDNPEDKTTYIIQAGAFRVQEDAEAMKAKLALAGYEARILTADVSGQPLYRVRLTPYKVLEDVNKAKSKLAENGIESTVIRMK
jgi:cell division protein FtsN